MSEQKTVLVHHLTCQRRPLRTITAEQITTAGRITLSMFQTSLQIHRGDIIEIEIPQ